MKLIQPFILFVFLTGESYASGISSGIAAGAALALLFMFLLSVIPASLLIVAFKLQKKRKYNDWLMIVLVLPSILYGALCCIYLPVAVYESDIYMGLVGVVGVLLLAANYWLYLSCKEHHIKMYNET